MRKHNQMSRQAFRRKQKIAAVKERLEISNRSRLSEWETEHENLLAELLSQESGEVKDEPKEKNADA